MTSSIVSMLRPQTHQLCNRLSIADFFQQFRSDQRHRFRIVELQPAALSLPREFTGGEDHQLFDFTRVRCMAPENTDQHD